MARDSPPARTEVSLSCTICQSRNYKTTRRRGAGHPPLSLRKFCRVCNAHTVHLEAK